MTKLKVKKLMNWKTKKRCNMMNSVLKTKKTFLKYF